MLDVSLRLPSPELSLLCAALLESELRHDAVAAAIR